MRFVVLSIICVVTCMGGNIAVENEIISLRKPLQFYFITVNDTIT